MAQIHPPAHLGKLFGAIAMAPANGKNHRAGHSFRIHRLQQRFNGGVVHCNRRARLHHYVIAFQLQQSSPVREFHAFFLKRPQPR